MQRFHVRRGAIWMLTAFAVVVTGCGGDSTGPGGNGNGNGGAVMTTSVSVVDNAFDPAAIQVSPGATVTWTWNGSATHNVNFASASIADGPSQISGTYAVAMPTTPGTYSYVCDFHPGIMTGSVLVQ
jgi:plastocyanin